MQKYMSFFVLSIGMFFIQGCLNDSQKEDNNSLPLSASIGGNFPLSWVQFPDFAYDIGVGNGTPWILRTGNGNTQAAHLETKTTGGVYWQDTKSGGGLRIDSWKKPNGTEEAWVVNGAGQVYTIDRVGQVWNLISSTPTMKDISVGKNGTIYALGTSNVGSNIYRWTGSTWYSVAGVGTKISVDDQGNPWVVNSAGDLWALNGGTWILKNPAGDPRAKSVGCGFGKVWIVGTDYDGTVGNSIYLLDGTSYRKANGRAMEIDVSSETGALYVTNSKAQIYWSQYINYP